MVRLRRIASGLLLSAVTIALMLLLLEAGIRIFADVEPPLRVRDGRIGEHYLRSFDQSVHVDEGGKKIRLRFNRYGFRGPDRPEEKPQGMKRVAVLGDSMIAALAVAEEETLVGRLEQRLRAQDASWEVHNFGVSASSPGQSMVLYRELVSKLDPDVVVAAFFVGNDLADSSKELDHYPRIYFDLDERTGELAQLPFSAGRARSSSLLNRYSRLYVWQKRAVNNALHTAAESARVLPPSWWIYATNPPPKVEHAWRIVAAVLRAFRDDVERAGARFVVLVIPSGREIYPETFTEVLEMAKESGIAFDAEHPEQRLAEICAESNLECVLPKARFLAAAGERLLFFNRTGHMTAAGNELAADALFEALSEEAPPD